MKRFLTLLLLCPLALNAMSEIEGIANLTITPKDIAELTILASLIKASDNQIISDRKEKYWAPPILGSEETAISNYCKENSGQLCYTIKFKSVYNDPENAAIQLTYTVGDTPSNTVMLPYNNDVDIPYENESKENNGYQGDFILRIKNHVEFE